MRIGRPLRGFTFQSPDRPRHLLLHHALDVSPTDGEGQLAVNVGLLHAPARRLDGAAERAAGAEAIQIAWCEIVQEGLAPGPDVVPPSPVLLRALLLLALVLRDPRLDLRVQPVELIQPVVLLGLLGVYDGRRFRCACLFRPRHRRRLL